MASPRNIVRDKVWRIKRIIRPSAPGTAAVEALVQLPIGLRHYNIVGIKGI